MSSHPADNTPAGTAGWDDMDPETVAYFAERGFVYSWGNSEFLIDEDEWYKSVRLKMGGWAASYWHESDPDLGVASIHWHGPFFSSPLTAYVHAEAADWGRN